VIGEDRPESLPPVQAPRLTKRQAYVYSFIRSFIKEHGYPPTRREIADACSFSSVYSVTGHVSALCRKGVLFCDASVARGIRLCEAGWPWQLQTKQGEVIGLVWHMA